MAETQRAPGMPLQHGSVASSPKNIKKKVTEASQPATSQLEEVESHTQETNGEHETNGEVETNGEYYDDDDDDDEGTEAVLAGSVDHNGNVVNGAGKIIGKVNSENPSEPEGSTVDVEGDILDAEGNVIGQAEIEDVAKDVAKDASTAVEKPDLAAPFGVQDNGEVTNATGGVVGKLTEGTPQRLVGTAIKEIDAEGNLKAESGSTLGKADLHSQILDRAEDATQVDSEVPKIDEEKIEGASQLGSQAPKLDEEKFEGASEVGSQVPRLDEEKFEGASEVGSQVPRLDEEKLEGASQVGSQVPKLDEEKLERASQLDSQAPLNEENLKSISQAGSRAPKLDGESISPSKVAGSDKLGVSGSQLPEQPEVAGSQAPSNLDNIASHVSGSQLPDEPKLDSEGNAIPDLDSEGNVIPDLSILKGKKVNKLGKIVDENGNPFGQLVEGEVKKLVGKKVDAEGKIWDDSGRVIGHAGLLPEDERETEPSAPFEDFPDSLVGKSGNIIYEGKIVGKLIEGDAKKLEGKKVDADGDVLDKNGNILGKAERYQEEDVIPEPEEVKDLSDLEGKKVNKAGNIVDDQGRLFGRVVTGDLSKLIGKKVGAGGQIFSESGKVIGTAELIPVDDRDEETGSPFEDFPNAIVDKHGNILYEGQIVGKLIEGDAKKLVGKKIDKGGEIVDKIGNVLGKAERWIEEDVPEPEPVKVDMSALAGKRVNKIGNVVDYHGQIYGRLVEGDPKRLAGKMCDKDGNVWSEGGDIIGKAELVPESEREGQKEGPFSGFSKPTVTKDGKVADAKGVIIGRLIEGDAKKLYGKEVDPDGDVLDTNGNTLGKAERWQEEEKEKPHNPVGGRKVNREGNVVDENGDVIAKLTDGTIMHCSGKEIDEDGDVYNTKGAVIGHVTLLEDIPPEPEAEPEPEPEPEPTETPEEAEARRQVEQDRKLASRMSAYIQQSLDKVNPILKTITSEIDHVLAQKEEERDEQKLVDIVKPLIEQGAAILTETNGAIRALDPDGRIAAQAKQRAGSRDATPEEAALAEGLKELAGNVSTTIEQAKKKIAGLPHAKKELNPLWGLLAEPLGQILAAVGLLLSGVLGLVGKLLAGLGLGGLLDNLLGGLGIKGILKGLGLGMVTESLTGRK